MTAEPHGDRRNGPDDSIVSQDCGKTLRQTVRSHPGAHSARVTTAAARAGLSRNLDRRPRLSRVPEGPPSIGILSREGP